MCVNSSAVNEATFTWSGQLPPRNNKDPLYSCKVFLGGVPWDITEGNVTSGCLLSFLPLRIGLAGSALDVGASFPASVKLEQSRQYFCVLIFKSSSGKTLSKCVWSEPEQQMRPFYK